ncbi:SubName: Full=Uncharacterized protein {ECO:0000313/EMBL:CCA70892.1} [Serendipita indica DSM 11827]|uniref:PIPK domain-containing protein n=1 Tax=Serendipita indica (strain DSM 11827) TaxID=1109443 RepID=G4THU3_SERID|nr:SubName: Full=Uncharacterized protein {ECO:0000313/EMBL:CCA70892.1} [Serendipita indica DSM 11827]CCA70892.1 hypothetical protein PIIN_04828 [Serendipita indica DSM 11827]
MSTTDERHESAFTTSLRDAIKPIYSKEYRVNMTARSIQSALKRDFEQERREIKRADREQWDWGLPLKTKWRLTKMPLIYMVHLQRAAPLEFARLREEHFSITDESYRAVTASSLKSLSNLGLSGSAFFHTEGPSTNAGLIIKSINRAFEYEFMHETLLPRYIEYIEARPGADSLLTRITDVLFCADLSLGEALNVSPRHYMVMVDVLGDLKAVKGAQKWDLKPSGFFEPTRDLVPDIIKSEATKSGLADTLDADVRIKLTKSQYDDLIRVLEQDTAFLEELETVDYSLLLGRFPASSSPQPPLGLDASSTVHLPISDVLQQGASKIKRALGISSSQETEDVAPTAGASASGREGQKLTGDDFTKGVLSADGEWVYRLTIVDFLWNVNKLVPTVMRTAGKVLPDQTITTEPARYRQEFMKMVEEYVEVADS